LAFKTAAYDKPISITIASPVSTLALDIRRFICHVCFHVFALTSILPFGSGSIFHLEIENLIFHTFFFQVLDYHLPVVIFSEAKKALERFIGLIIWTLSGTALFACLHIVKDLFL
jgi:hypothetical protein